MFQTTQQTSQIDKEMQREREAFATLRVSIVVVGGGLIAGLITSNALNKVEDMIRLSKPGTAEEQIVLDKVTRHSEAATKGALKAVNKEIPSPKWFWGWFW